MNNEKIILITSLVIALSSLVFIPKNKRVQAQYVFLFVQFPTWVLGLSVVQLGLIEYPYREIGRVNSTSFLFEYFILPILCIHFNAHFPKHATIVKKISIYALTSLAVTIIEVVLERYTNVIKYTGWQWYWTFISLWFLLWLSRIMKLWFFSQDRFAKET